MKLFAARYKVNIRIICKLIIKSVEFCRRMNMESKHPK
jgi:hypothetical protein